MRTFVRNAKRAMKDNIHHSAPLCGDPLDNEAIKYISKAMRMGYSYEEATKRLETTEKIEIIISEKTIVLGGYPLDNLDPTCKAFYVLLSRHPGGIPKKDMAELYQDEFRDILEMIPRGRAQPKSKKAQSTTLSDQASLYKCKINNAINKIEKDHDGINLSSCRVGGGDGDPFFIYRFYLENHFLKVI